jgi:hypothetical protein
MVLLNAGLYFTVSRRNVAFFTTLKKIVSPNSDLKHDRLVAMSDFTLLIYSMFAGFILAIRYMAYTSSQYAEAFKCGDPCNDYNFISQRTPAEMYDDAVTREHYKSFFAHDCATYLSLFLMAISVCD